MKLFLAILFFFTTEQQHVLKQRPAAMNDLSKKKYTYLALGDSYTIGEMVSPDDNFPNQVTRMMQSEGYDFDPARIIAKTGWTTDELQIGIAGSANEEPLLDSYDFVSLLIGVNNQYRSRSLENYAHELEELISRSIIYAGNKTDHVVLLSIPDWGVTPFAAGKNAGQIAKEIDSFNKVNSELALKHHIYYIDITAGTREAATENSLLAKDGLHPSGKEYKRWAEQISAYIKTKL